MSERFFTQKQVEEIVNQLQGEIADLRAQLNSVQPSKKGVVLSEIRKLYKQLNDESNKLAEQIISAIDVNDYVQFLQLKTARKNVQSGIQELERSYGDDLTFLTAFRGRMSERTKNSAAYTRNKGEELLNAMGNGAKWINDNTSSAFIKGMEKTNKGVDHGIRFNDKISRYLLNKTVNGLNKLSDVLKK